MSAPPRPIDPADAWPPALLPDARDRSLGGLLAERDPAGSFVEVAPGAPGTALSSDAAGRAVAALARRFAALPIAGGSAVGLRLPGGAEWACTFLAAERAGLVPVCLPLAVGLGPLARMVETLRLEAVVTCAALGDTAPARDLAAVARGYFGLRFPMAFGDDVPDGIERLALAPVTDSPEPVSLHGVYATLPRPPSAGPAILSPIGSLRDAARMVVAAAGIEPGDRILHLGATERLAGLATGLAAALEAEASILWIAPFEAAQLAAALGENRRTHVVIPAAAEPALARVALGRSVRSVVVLHEPPTRLATALRSPWPPVVDVLALDETVLVTGRRDVAGRPNLSADGAVRIEPDGRAELLGETLAWGDGEAVRIPFSLPAPLWRPTAWSPEVFAGRLIAIADAGAEADV